MLNTLEERMSMKKEYLYILSIGFALLVPPLSWGQDTVRRSSLKSVTISATPTVSDNRSQTPTQVYTHEKLEKQGVLQLSDAVRRMAGITLKDYGGVGGVKTVSARGLGSQFSTLTIDGVAVSDAQNGQVDLGRYMVGNSAYISLSIGQHDNTLQSARSYASGSVINMETLKPAFAWDKNHNISIGFECGSFGHLAPTLRYEQKLSDKLQLSFSGQYLHSDGDYPFTLYYTNNRTDSSSREYRKNSQVDMGAADLNIFYQINHSHSLHTKIHYTKGFHALPGPVTYYNSHASERSKESVGFAQTRYKYLGEKVRIQTLGKIQRGTDIYEDTAADNISGFIHNKYTQQEAYMSAAVAYTPVQGLTLSYSGDAALNLLESNLKQNSHVRRRTLLNVIALKYQYRWITLNGSLLHTHTTDQCNSQTVTTAPSGREYDQLSPYAGFTIKPWFKESFRLRYFFKENYRVPNFNELYYFTIPRELNPEKAHQHNIGATWSKHYTTHSDKSGDFTIAIDFFRNNVYNKIIAIPTQNMFLWSMMNLGEVYIQGLEVKSDHVHHFASGSISTSLTYSYQHAVDITDPESKTYNHQIPYTPKHSGNIALYYENRFVNIGYNAMWVGKRFYRQQNSADCELPSYHDHSISIDRDFALPIGELKLQAQILNLFDVQYEVVHCYPMMGRHFKVKIVYTF